jgi:deoxyribodipyrimidine photo-lyase
VSKENEYRSLNAMQFMERSLHELDAELKKRGSALSILHGQAEAVLDTILKHTQVDAVFCNYDYTPFALSRDKKLEKVCAQYKVPFYQSHDLLLHAPEEVLKADGKPYTIFTPFYKKACTLPLQDVDLYHGGSLTPHVLEHSLDHRTIETLLAVEHNDSIQVRGGRTEGLYLLKKIKSLGDYKKNRDQLAAQTTHLSAHLKFGTLSVREVYAFIKDHISHAEVLLRQLYWRDFFTHIAYHFPRVFGHAFNERYDALQWNSTKEHFERWCTGTTGFPIVDAGMRQLNATGYMHNRARMIVASFLTKDLHIDWRWGERYFAQQLVDYDPAVNNGSWQWAASTGCDAQPYFRIFNPWLQQKKFDPECRYIQQWVAELKSVSPALIHTWYKESSPAIKNYPRPMVDHAVESAKAKAYYKHAGK